MLSCGQGFGSSLLCGQEPGRLAALKQAEATLLTQLVSCHNGRGPGHSRAGSPPKDPRVADMNFWSMTISLQCLAYEVSAPSNV